MSKFLEKKKKEKKPGLNVSSIAEHVSEVFTQLQDGWEARKEAEFVLLKSRSVSNLQIAFLSSVTASAQGPQ